MISGSSSFYRKKLVGREMPMLKLATEDTVEVCSSPKSLP